LLRNYVYQISTSKCPIRSSVNGETAGLVNFDGPSLPSVNCCSSWCSTTGPISLLLVKTSSKCSNLRCLIKNLSTDSGVSQNGRKRPQKGKRHPFGCHFGHFHLCWRGDKLENPLN